MTEPALIERITRSLAFMLRHRPERFDLEVDSHGYADVEEVIRALNERLGEPVDEEDLERAVTAGSRVRYEIEDDRIRALYGHSIPVEAGPDCEPPDFLFVGLPTRDVERALSHGLRGGRRSYLHLALTEQDAIETGRRLAAEYSVLKIQAIDAWEEGTNFYDRRSLFLAEEIPADMLELVAEFEDGEDPQPRGGPRGNGRGPRGRSDRGGRGGRGRDRNDDRPSGRGRDRDRDRDRDREREEPRAAAREESYERPARPERSESEDEGSRVRGRARRPQPEEDAPRGGRGRGPRGRDRDDERSARESSTRSASRSEPDEREERRPARGRRPARSSEGGEREERAPRPRRAARSEDRPEPAGDSGNAGGGSDDGGFGLGVFGGKQRGGSSRSAPEPERESPRRESRPPAPRAPRPEPKPEPKPEPPAEPEFGDFGAGL